MHNAHAADNFVFSAFLVFPAVGSPTAKKTFNGIFLYWIAFAHSKLTKFSFNSFKSVSFLLVYLCQLKPRIDRWQKVLRANLPRQHKSELNVLFVERGNKIKISIRYYKSGKNNVSLCRYLFLLFNFVSAYGQNDISKFVLFSAIWMIK